MNTQLPSATDAEQQVIGAMLMEPPLLAEVSKRLHTRDFQDPCNQATYATLLAMHGERVPIDVVSLQLRLETSDVFVKVDYPPAAYLAEAGQAVTTIAHCDYYVGLVAEASRKRRVHDIASTAAEHALNGKASSEVLNDLWADIESLQREQESDDWVCAADVEPKDVDWQWEHRIPYSMISILEAEPEAGKSQITMSIVARATTGQPMPPHDGDHGTFDPINVLLLNCEDSTSCTIRPRLEANGADLRRVFIRNGLMSFPGDAGKLRDTIVQHDAKLVIIDPINSYLDQSIDTHNDSSIRYALSALSILAEETGCAILIIRHHNKAVGQSAMHRGIGSIGYTGVARSVLMAAKSPDDPDERYLARVKGNLCAPPTVLAYRIEAVGKTSKVVWIGARPDLTPDKILGTKAKPAKQEIDLKERLETDRNSVCQILAKDPETKTAISNLAAISGNRAKDAVDSLLADGHIRPTMITKNGKKYDGFGLAIDPDTTPTVGVS